MKLNYDQSNAMGCLTKWLGDPGTQEFRLGGYAGTGKTTLLKHLIASIDKMPYCCAPTGKAASVLNRKLNEHDIPVTTIHKLIYQPRNNEYRKKLEAEIVATKRELQQHPENHAAERELNILTYKLKATQLEFNNKDHGVGLGDLIIVDEASMVTGRIYDDLRNTRAKLLLVGDPGQLPPVNGTSAFDSQKPDFVLEQIMRQEEHNSIIKLASDVRLGRVVGGYDEEHCRIVHKSAVHDDEWLAADQIITGRNETRRHTNRWMRGLLRRASSRYPVQGEKLICLKNAYNGDELLYINGVQAIVKEDAYIPEGGTEGLYCTIEYEGELRQCVPMAQEPFAAHYDRLFTESDEYQDAYRFDYAYSITVHKAQGSEWDNVMLADDGMSEMKAEFRRRWLYTAITRAAKRFTWVKK